MLKYSLYETLTVKCSSKVSNCGKAETLLSNARRLEVDFLHSRAILLPKFSSKSNLAASRHIEREKNSASFLGFLACQVFGKRKTRLQRAINEYHAMDHGNF